jgi:hypothetical protein
MLKVGQTEVNRSMEKPGTDALNDLIGRQVLQTLGQPPDLVTVQVRPLWEGAYRVNIFVGKDIVSAKILNSYFVGTDADGVVVASTPKITKQY